MPKNCWQTGKKKVIKIRIIIMTKRISIILFSMLCCMSMLAQSSAVKKTADAVFSLTTFKNDGSIVGTTNGVFIDNDGTCISAWKPFDGADYAVVIDAKGNRHQVDAIYGANEIYDLVRFRIADKAPASAKAAATHAATSAKVWLVPNKKSDSPKETTVKSVETFMEKYAYYVVESPVALSLNLDLYEGCPVVDANGQLLGLYHVSSSNQSVTDSRYTEEFKATGFSLNNATLRRTNIRIALPTDISQARLALVFAKERGGTNFSKTVDDFIRLFPKENDGYFEQALLAVKDSNITVAESTMQKAVKEVDNKAEAHYNYSRLMMMTGNLDKALSEAQQAYAISSLPIYQEQEAKVYYAKGEYQKAYDMFISLTKTSMRNAELYYEAMQARQQLGGSDAELLALLDSAVAVCDTPYTAIAAPYFLARGMQHDKMKQYRKAMSDLYTYEALYYGPLSAEFYYLRAQSEANGRIFQPALNDYARAIALDPKNLMYWAEMASLTLRVGEKENAIKAAKRCIELDPNYPDAYLILGIAQVETGKKAEGIQNIEKAKQLGNTQADNFLKKYK